jgi:lysine biosynthesis protein LysW
MATCPECDAEIDITDDDLEELQVGDGIDCDECGAALVISSLDPLEFDIDDDDDDEDDDDEDDEDEEEDDLGDGDDDLDDLEEDEDGDDDNWDE